MSADPDPNPDILALQQTLWSSCTPVDFARAFETNVTAAYYTTVAFLELLHKGNTRHTHPEGVLRTFNEAKSQREGSVSVSGGRGGETPGAGSKFAEARGRGCYSFFSGTMDGRKSDSRSPSPSRSGLNVGNIERPFRPPYQYGRANRDSRVREGFESVTSQVITVTPVDPRCKRSWQARERRIRGEEGARLAEGGSGGGGRGGERGEGEGGWSVPYVLSKVAERELGRMMAELLKEWDIRCNTIAPGVPFDAGERGKFTLTCFLSVVEWHMPLA